MIRFGHLVNPVGAAADPELQAGQRLTFESMRRAQRRAAEAGVTVTLVCAQLPADRVELEGFVATPDLERTVLDLSTFVHPRPLPLIGDLLGRLAGASDAEVLIYTNADIVLHADFYREVARELASGHDALVINRRTVRRLPDRAPDVEWVTAQQGEPHGGYDCFVWARELLAGLDFHGLCIGFPPIGRVLTAALSTRARSFAHLTDRSITFHVDDEKSWQNKQFQDYWRHNQRAGLRALDDLAARTPLSPLAASLRAGIAAQEEL